MMWKRQASIVLPAVPRRRVITVRLVLATGSVPSFAHADCFDEAATFHHVNP